MDDLNLVALAGPHSRYMTPAGVVLKDNAGVDGTIWLKDADRGTWYPADAWTTRDGKTEIALVIPHMHPYQEIELELDPAGPAWKKDLEAKPPVLLKRASDTHVDVKVLGEAFTSFHYNDAERPYLFPLIGPQGQGMTREYPCKEVKGETSDHPHHRSVWTAYGEVAEVDHWSVSGMHGLQKVVGNPIIASGVAVGRISADIQWRNKFGDEENSIDEHREIKFHALPRGMQSIDFDITLSATHGDVLFGDTKEGGFLSVRVATVMDGDKGGVIENCFGATTESECWGKQAPWCDYSGVVKGFKAGVAIMEHPASFSYPTHWHVRDYGLFSANPFGLKYFTNGARNGDFTLANGKSITFTYRLLVHAGDARGGKVAERYLDYIAPPVVKVLDF